ncbi:MAG: hypothetical protein DRP63_09150 [Planctomycetota bacterium]|nr:MAG: hypothetical protein DRP63_09150 [Planctomycetota bacterium]
MRGFSWVVIFWVALLLAQQKESPSPEKPPSGTAKKTPQKQKAPKKEKVGKRSAKKAAREKAKERVALYLRDGSRFEGEPVGEKGGFYVLRLEKAKLRVPKSLLQRVVRLEEERRFVLMAFGSEEDAEWAARRLRMGEAPSHIARIESLHPCCATDAIIDFSPRSALPKELSQKVFSAKQRQVPDPFEFDGFFWVIRVERSRWSEPKHKPAQKKSTKKESIKTPQKQNPPQKEEEKRNAVKELRLGRFTVLEGGPKVKDAADFVRSIVKTELSAAGIRIVDDKGLVLRGEVGYKLVGAVEYFSVRLWVEKGVSGGKPQVVYQTRRLTVGGRDGLSGAVSRLVRDVVGGLGGGEGSHKDK